MNPNNFMLNGVVNYAEVTRVLALLSALPLPNREANEGDVEVVAPGNIGPAAVEEIDQELPSPSRRKKKDKAVYKGFEFIADFRNRDETKRYWCCVNCRERNGKCKARLHTLVRGNFFVKFLPHSQLDAHNHALDSMSVPLSKVMANLKRRAVDTREKPKELLNHELQSVPSALGPSLKDSAIRKMVRRVRIANQIPVVEAGRVQDIDIPVVCQMYQDGSGNEELFFLGDSGKDDPERVMLFGREKHIEWSRKMKVVYMDGSFSITPAPFYQVYAILAERSTRDESGGKWVFPVLYALLPSKSQAVYTKLFIMIKELWPEFKPRSISVDFELAAIQALLDVFPGWYFN